MHFGPFSDYISPISYSTYLYLPQQTDQLFQNVFYIFQTEQWCSAITGFVVTSPKLTGTVVAGSVVPAQFTGSVDMEWYLGHVTV